MYWTFCPKFIRWLGWLCWSCTHTFPAPICYKSVSWCCLIKWLINGCVLFPRGRAADQKNISHNPWRIPYTWKLDSSKLHFSKRPFCHTAHFLGLRKRAGDHWLLGIMICYFFGGLTNSLPLPPPWWGGQGTLISLCFRENFLKLAVFGCGKYNDQDFQGWRLVAGTLSIAHLILYHAPNGLQIMCFMSCEFRTKEKLFLPPPLSVQPHWGLPLEEEEGNFAGSTWCVWPNDIAAT